MKKKHLTQVILVIVGLIGMLTAPPMPTTAQSSFDCASVTEIPQTECQALVALYNATGGNMWFNRTGWLQTTTPCSWFGVTCQANHVKQLTLNNNALEGVLPPEIGNLTALTHLDLSRNYVYTEEGEIHGVYGALPPEIGNLSYLAYLDLSYNHYLTTLPSEIWNLTNLTSLDLSYNHYLTTLPSEIWNLTNLTSLALAGYTQAELPPQIGNLTNLTYLNVSGPFTTLPSEIGNLASLTVLDLEYGKLTSLPTTIGNLKHLTTLNLNYNALTSLPAEFGGLTSLITLTVAGNGLTAVPPEFGNLASLITLDMNINQLATLPAEFGNLDKLTSLNLGNNKLSTLPPVISSLSGLTYLGLQKNGLTTLPLELGNLSRLTELNLEGNNLTSLPPVISTMSGLTTLNISGNGLTTLPAEFGNLSNLTNLTLNGNSWVSLPPEFGNLSKLANLDMSGGTLASLSLPAEFGNLSSLGSLNMSYSDLTELPTAVCDLPNLTNLYIALNPLTTLPPEIGKLTHLTYLDIWWSNLHSLPEEFGNLTSLKVLKLGDNYDLRGAVPDFMARLTSLEYIDFNGTRWCMPGFGPVTTWWGKAATWYDAGLACSSLGNLSLDPAPELDAHAGAFFKVTAAPDLTYYPITFTWNTGEGTPIVHVSTYPVTDTAWLYWDTSGHHTLTVTAANAAGVVTATQSVFIRPTASTIVLPDAPASLVYTNTQGLPTTLDIPAGSVTQTAALLYSARPVATPPVPSLRSAGSGFAFDLYREGRLVPNGASLAVPATLTLKYSAADIAGIDRLADLQLMRQDSNGWQPAACGPVAHDLDQRVLSTPVCRLGQFALFGPATLTKLVEPTTTIANGSLLTYTLVFSDPEGNTLRVFDPISPTLEWQGFVGAPPEGIAFADGVISGALTLSPAHPLTLSFTVRAQLPETAFTGEQATVANTAYFCPADTACILRPSNTVSTTVRGLTRIFLPLVQRQLSGAEAIQACDETGWCKYFGFNDFQKALDYANLYPTRAMTLTLQPGVFSTDSYLTGVKQKDWMVDCLSISYGASFLLKNRTAPTLIQGASGNPADVVILGGPTSWYANTPKANIAHALTLEDNSGPVTLAHITLISHGGRSDRGLGGDVLNVLNSTGVLTHSIVAGNRTNANPLYLDWLHASTPMTLSLVQEGVYLYGPNTHFDIVNSLIAGNFHTGVMAAENAQGRIIASLVRDNGWNDWDPSQNALKSHGITTLGGPYFAGCYLENSQLKIWNNLILHNNGNGIFLRGSLTDITTGVTQNTIALNANRGIWVDGLTLYNAGSLFIANNLVLTNTAAGIAFGDQVAGAVGSIQLYHNNSGQNLGPNFSPPGYSGIVGITTRQNNIELSNPLLDAIYRPLPGSQLLGAGWAMDDPNANPTPDISSYSYILYPQYVFQPDTLDLWCQLYTALSQIGAPTYPNPCP